MEPPHSSRPTGDTAVTAGCAEPASSAGCDDFCGRHRKSHQRLQQPCVQLKNEAKSRFLCTSHQRVQEKAGE